jgi:hypothetical protein
MFEGHDGLPLKATASYSEGEIPATPDERF